MTQPTEYTLTNADGQIEFTGSLGKCAMYIHKKQGLTANTQRMADQMRKIVVLKDRTAWGYKVAEKKS